MQDEYLRLPAYETDLHLVGVNGKTILLWGGVPKQVLYEWQVLVNKYARNVYPSENSDYRTGISLQVRALVSSKMSELVS